MTTERAPFPAVEMERLLHLSALNIDFLNVRGNFNHLAKLAASIAGTSMSQVNLIDFHTQWTVSDFGLVGDTKPREETVCQYTILNSDYFEVKDLSADHRFWDRDYVLGDPEIRYYLGIPLSVADGLNVGALCVLDKQSRSLTNHQIELLRIVADEIVAKLQSVKAVNQLMEQLSDSEKSKRKVAHDIRGPLAGIIGLAQIIEGQGDDNDISEVLELVGLIQQSGSSLIDLTQEILGSKEDRENSIAYSLDSSLTDLKVKLQRLYEPQARQKGIALIVTANAERERQRFRNRRLLQIVGNLIGNALKFTEEGGRVEVCLDLVLKDDGGKDIEIMVSDTGCGLSEAQINAITTGNVTSSNGTGGEPGFGLGLGFVNALLEKERGILHISSVLGKGSKFTITLPLSL